MTTRTNVLTIRLVTPVDLTDEQGEIAYNSALSALIGAIPDLAEFERVSIVDESGFGFGDDA